jgi:hypothetical protein
MNAAIRTIAVAGIARGHRITGVRRGYSGGSRFALDRSGSFESASWRLSLNGSFPPRQGSYEERPHAPRGGSRGEPRRRTRASRGLQDS